ncbi:MAG: 16S rRNA (uracil(1498)-N(3))-methyltransferase [Deferribacterales bacterium]
MNIILIKPEETNNDTAYITGDRYEHIRRVLKLGVGDSLKTGILGGMLGTAVIEDITADRATLRFDCNQEPPKPMPVSLVLALPRPKVFRRIFFGLVCAGVKDIHIINSWRVDKSYWDSPYLERTDEYIFDALQQSKDTMPPKVTFHRYFMGFIEEGLAEIDTPNRYIANPSGSVTKEFEKPLCLAVGCEGGFIQKELDTFEKQGFRQFSIGARILTTEYAVPYILGMIK